MAAATDRASMQAIVEQLLHRKRRQRGEAPSYPSGTRADLLPKIAPRPLNGPGTSVEEEEPPLFDVFSMDL